MNQQPDYSTRSRLPLTRIIGQRSTLFLAVSLLALLSACQRETAVKGPQQRMKLTVGDIQEVTIDARQDTTWRLSATSDNQEVVDVSRKPSVTAADNEPTARATGPTAFLIKGVTVGTARVVFSEKPVGEEGDGRIKRTYVVTVV
ncbi:hypothetical protein LC612_40650, partial [Nostoc sp. CHAB 5834]|nr:hypothetical protein [Nostoc sp. CHAB 5834]